MEQHWYTDIFRSIFAAIDGIVYNLISDAYGLLEKIAQVKVFGNDDISSITNKVYTIIGIFMLFKLTFSFITYIVNPDAMTDKDKGVQKIIQNIVIMFAMLIMCPWVFDKLWGLQTVMLKENIVGNFIFGTDDSEKLNGYKFGVDCKEDSTPASVGDYIALMSLKGFYQPYNKSSMGSDMWDKVESSSNFTTVNDNLCYKVSKGKVSYYLNSNIYNKAVRISGFGPWGNDVYIMNYRFGISTAVGVVVLLILVGFCMDVGLRVVKLSFLEIIAPIPIVSYVDPKSSKNGIFKKWLKEVGSTWASVFIRLFALFFAVSVIQKVGHLEDAVTGETVTNTWVNLFVIIGALMFAKQLPKLITDITGINLNGGFNLNPLKKVADQALGGKALIGVGAAGLGLVASGITGAAANAYAYGKNKNSLYNQLRDETSKTNPDSEKVAKLATQLNNMNGRRLFATTAGGLVGGARRGISSGYKTGAKGKINVLKNVKDDVKDSNTARNNRSAIRDYNNEVKRTGKGDAYTFFDRNVNERLDKFAGIKNEYGGYGYYQKQIDDLTRKIEDNDSQEEGLRNQYARIVADNGLDYSKFEKFHKEMKDLLTITAADLHSFASSNSMNYSDVQRMESVYSTTGKTLLSSIDAINSETKEYKKERKQYQEMVDTRKEATKK